jgi:hypothetical protein
MRSLEQGHCVSSITKTRVGMRHFAYFLEYKLGYGGRALG